MLGIYDNYAELIFKKLYNVRVPVLSTYTNAELDVVGIPMNVIDGSRKNNMAELVEVMIPISDMIEKYKNGFKITVVKPDDVIHIFNVIQKHLLAWKNQNRYSVNQELGPNDDLVIMDKLANEIFNGNKITIVKDSEVEDTGWSLDFRSKLMSPVKEEKPEIIYAEVDRESLAPEVEYKGKYNLNDLLK